VTIAAAQPPPIAAIQLQAANRVITTPDTVSVIGCPPPGDGAETVIGGESEPGSAENFSVRCPAGQM